MYDQYGELFKVRKGRRFFNQTDAYFGFGIGLIAMQLGGLAVAFFAGETLALLAIQLSGLAFVLIYLNVKKINIKTAMPFKKLKPVNIPILLVMSVALLFAAMPILNIVYSFLESINYQFTESAPYESVGAEIFAILVISLLPAVCEEFVFRGMVMRGFQHKGKWFAIIVSALLFTLMHGNPVQTVHPLIIGIAMGFAVFTTGSIFASMILHFGNNLFAMLLELYLWNSMFDDYQWLFALAGLVVFAGATYFLIITNKNKGLEYEKEPTLSEQLQKNMYNFPDMPYQQLPEDVLAQHRFYYYNALNTERNKRNSSLIWFWISFGLCALSWIIMFFSGFLAV